MRDDILYIRDILERINRIESYTVDGYEAFISNRMAQEAVERNLEVIGEATKRLSSNFRQSYPDVPWRKIAGLRDVLIHDYGLVDVNEIWKVVEQNLPDLKSQVEAILRQNN